MPSSLKGRKVSVDRPWWEKIGRQHHEVWVIADPGGNLFNAKTFLGGRDVEDDSWPPGSDFVSWSKPPKVKKTSASEPFLNYNEFLFTSETQVKEALKAIKDLNEGYKVYSFVLQTQVSHSEIDMLETTRARALAKLTATERKALGL